MHVPCLLSRVKSIWPKQSTTAMPLSPRLLARGAAWHGADVKGNVRRAHVCSIDLAWSDRKRRPHLPAAAGLPSTGGRGARLGFMPNEGRIPRAWSKLKTNATLGLGAWNPGSTNASASALLGIHRFHPSPTRLFLIISVANR